MNQKSGSEMAVVTSRGITLGKGDSRYWLQSGKLVSDPRWAGAFACRIQAQGRREFFPLRTSNKSSAAAKAARIYTDVAALGWDEALKKHKPDERHSKTATAGDLILAVQELADVRPTTLASNVNAFRRIVAAVAKIDSTKSRFAARGTGRKAWLAAVDAVPLAIITPATVEAWKLSFVAKQAAGDEIKARSARNTANATLRSAKSL
ncbi:hypothetical protein, partial [Prosthecobacter sp.]|uniref:hypothetical protein n=1 Tax=Prosthecobacter sp. TaxID=1965333 RepID=UPI002486EA75